MSKDHYISKFHLKYFTTNGYVQKFNLKTNKFEEEKEGSTKGFGIKGSIFTESSADILSVDFVDSFNKKHNSNIDSKHFKDMLQKIETETADFFRNIITNGLNEQNMPIFYMFTLFLRSPSFKENFIKKTLLYQDNGIIFKKQSDVIFWFFRKCAEPEGQKINNPLLYISTQLKYRLIKSDGYKFFLLDSFVFDLKKNILLLPISPNYALSTFHVNKEKLVVYFEECKKYSDFVYFQNKEDYDLLFER